MTDLKTLKELQYDESLNGYAGFLKAEDLRLEAQKWVDHLKKVEEAFSYEGLPQTNIKLRKWIEMFFNLKKEKPNDLTADEAGL